MTAGIVALLLLFVGCAVLILRQAALRLLATLAVAVVLIGVVLPLLSLRGVPPLLAALPAAVVMAFAGILIIGGCCRKSVAAALGAGTASLIACVLPLALGCALNLTALESDFGPRPHLEVRLWYGPEFGRADFHQLFVAAMILASLGAVMDVAMVIASAVSQVAAADGRRAFGRRFVLGVRVGARVLGPMLVTMLLIFAGSGLVFNVARAVNGGALRDSFGLLDYAGIAAQVVEMLTAGLGMLCCIPLTALFASLLLRRKRSDAGESEPVTTPVAGRFSRAGIRVIGPAAVLLVALALQQSFIATYDGEGVAVDPLRRTRAQLALARVTVVQPTVTLPVDDDAEYNPVRGRIPDRLAPCGARVLTGEYRGRMVAFMNRLEARPYVNLPLRRGSFARVRLTTRDDAVVSVEAEPPPVRWRHLLWAAAVILAAIVLLFGPSGGRSILLLIGAGVVVALIVIPLLARGVSPALVSLAAFLLVAAVMLAGWGGGLRPAGAVAAGTLAGLLAGGLVAFGAARLMGLDGGASVVISMLRQRQRLASLDFGLLLAAGATISALAAALDVGASVVAGLIEFRGARRGVSADELRTVGFRLNRDITGTMVLTLWFAWLALRQPVLLVAFRSPEAFMPEWMECYAMEVVPLVAASIAVILAGPLSAAVFAWCAGSARVAVSRERQRARVAHGILWVVFAGAIVASAAVAGKARLPAMKDPAWLAPLHRADSAGELLAMSAERQRAADWDASMILLWRAREINPANARVHRDLAYAYMARREFELARESIDKALPELKNDPRTHYISGIVAAWEGDVDRARSELQQALALDPAYGAAADALQALP